MTTDIMFAVLGSISGQDGEHSINEDDEVSAAVLDALGDVPYYDERNGNASGINGNTAITIFRQIASNNYGGNKLLNIL
jgi:hypothetical protein